MFEEIITPTPLKYDRANDGGPVDTPMIQGFGNLFESYPPPLSFGPGWETRLLCVFFSRICA